MRKLSRHEFFHLAKRGIRTVTGASSTGAGATLPQVITAGDAPKSVWGERWSEEVLLARFGLTQELFENLMAQERSKESGDGDSDSDFD